MIRLWLLSLIALWLLLPALVLDWMLDTPPPAPRRDSGAE